MPGPKVPAPTSGISLRRLLLGGVTLYVVASFVPRPLLTLPFSPLTYLRADDLIWVAVLCIALSSGVLNRHRLTSLPLRMPLLIFCLIVILSWFRVWQLSGGGIAAANSAWFIVRWFEYSSWYFIVGGLGITTRERDRLVRVAMLAAVAESAIMLLQHYSLLPELPYVVYNPGHRAPLGGFTAEQHLGVMLACALPLQLYLVEQSRNLRSALWHLPPVALLVLALLITTIRSAWLAGAVAFVVWALLTPMRYRRGLVLSFAALALLVGGAQLISSIYELRPFVGSAGELAFSGDQARLVSTQLALATLVAQPSLALWGIGFMNWGNYMSSITGLYAGHNNYVMVLVETGLAGLLAYLWIWWDALSNAWRKYRLRDRYAHIYLAMLAGILASCLTQETLYPVYALEGFLGFFLVLTALTQAAPETPAVLEETNS